MRQPKPFFRKFTATWYVQIGKKQINLGKDKEAAFQRYHEIMSSRGRAETTFDSVAHLFDAYLEWVKANRAETTYKQARLYLSKFAQHIGPGYTIAKLDGFVGGAGVKLACDKIPNSIHRFCERVIY